MLADQDLTEARRRNVTSSIRRFCAVLAIAPAQAPAVFRFFRERLGGFHPADAEMKARSWRTIRSDVAFALKPIDVAPNQPKPRVPPSEAWLEVRARMQAVGNRWAPARFVRFCEERGIPPSAIDDEAVAAFDDFIRTQRFKMKPGRHLRDTCLLWNRLAGAAADLQLRPVTLPCNRVTYTPPSCPPMSSATRG